MTTSAAARGLAPRMDPALMAGALVFAALIVPTLGAMALDERMHMGLDVWIKPLKFEVSIAVYLGTLALFAALLPDRVRRARWFRAYVAAVIAAFVYEIVWIGGAAALGTGSHYNVATPLSSALFTAAGVLAVLATSASGVFAWHVMDEPEAPPGPLARRAVALGLWLTVGLTVLTAGTLSGLGGHEVGGDGSDVGGWPVVGWQRDGGDPRAAHFLATHALQVVPLLGLGLAALAPRRGRAAVRAAGALYAGLTLYAFVEALTGRPFLSGLL